MTFIFLTYFGIIISRSAHVTSDGIVSFCKKNSTYLKHYNHHLNKDFGSVKHMTSKGFILLIMSSLYLKNCITISQKPFRSLVCVIKTRGVVCVFPLIGACHFRKFSQ